MSIGKCMRMFCPKQPEASDDLSLQLLALVGQCRCLSDLASANLHFPFPSNPEKDGGEFRDKALIRASRLELNSM
jgi:hypothetical protein